MLSRTVRRALQDANLPPTFLLPFRARLSTTPHYITAHLHGRPYLLTQGDTLRLPFLMPGVQPGDILRLNRASVVGSRDYTLKAGAPVASVASLPKEELGHADIRAKQSYVDERLFVCRAVVMGVEAEPMRIKEKTKQRQRHVRQVKSKHKFTVLRVQELRVRSLEEVEGRA
ncbi:hypothetical protein H2199_002682 [Coniosporium tulheliwenetii]|uniref:Uncharacterized protein n=1 Tax=Coniosporium tulheliwenetii TaxID=3383036 RepID=A0ACC2ZH06_9PEZI|nr:hypothetical protein H2199_002682 [Cladosporium sp. JES 115]